MVAVCFSQFVLKSLLVKRSMRAIANVRALRYPIGVRRGSR